MSDQSPYQPPQETGDLGAGGDRDKVRRVAQYQRWVIFALLFNILMNVISLLANFGVIPVPQVVIGLLAIGGALFAMFAIFLLGKELSGVGLGIICALLMIIPCISLLVLLIINQRATSFLQRNGVKVGFLGTSPDAI